MTSAIGSTRRGSTTRAPVSSRDTPRMPTPAWPNIVSARDRCGSDGMAGRSGRRSSTNSAAARASVWGRLPIPLAAPGLRCTVIRLSL